MDEPLAVGCVQRLGHLLDDANLFEQGHLRLGAVQRLADDELHGDVGIAGLVRAARQLADLVDLADVASDTE